MPSRQAGGEATHLLIHTQYKKRQQKTHTKKPKSATQATHTFIAHGDVLDLQRPVIGGTATAALVAGRRADGEAVILNVRQTANRQLMKVTQANPRHLKGQEG